MSAFTIKKVPQQLLWIALIFCTIYQSYRYPFQMSSSGTSPTYSDTPAVIQLGKFLVVLLICFALVPFLIKKTFPLRKWIIVLLGVALSAYTILKAVSAQSDQIDYLIVGFWPLAALVIVLSSSPIDVKAVRRYFSFVLFFTFASTFIELVLFFTIGRLPALAYSDSFFVRFGGFLDDPNGFAALLYMLIAWVHFEYSGRRRFILQLALVLCVLLTQSFTAIGFLGLLGLFFGIKFFVRRPIIFLLGSALIIGWAAYFWRSLINIFTFVMTTHSGSLDDHLSQISGTKAGSIVDWIAGGSSYVDYESWWVGSLVNYGIFWYLLSIVLVAGLTCYVLRAFLYARNPQHKAVLSGILMLSCYFVFGNLNLPLFAVFPINFLFFFFSYLVFFDRLSSEELPTVQTVSHRILSAEA